MYFQYFMFSAWLLRFYYVAALGEAQTDVFSSFGAGTNALTLKTVQHDSVVRAPRRDPDPRKISLQRLTSSALAIARQCIKPSFLQYEVTSIRIDHSFHT